MNKFTFTVEEEDFQVIARERFGRELTAEELSKAAHRFEKDIPWCEVAEAAVEEAVENDKAACGRR
jgi:hypothetical protein